MRKCRQAIRSCVAATVRRDLRVAVTTTTRSREERVTFRWRRFLLTYQVVTASTAQLCLMTQDEIRERRFAGSTGDTRSSPSQSGVQANDRQDSQQETATDVNTSDRQTRVRTIEASGRLADASFGLSTPNRFETVSGECSTGVDDVSVMRSPLGSEDRSGRHSNKSVTDNLVAGIRKGVGTRYRSDQWDHVRCCLSQQRCTDWCRDRAG